MAQNAQQQVNELAQLVGASSLFGSWFNFDLDTKPIDEAFIHDNSALILPWKSSIFQAHNDPIIDVQLNGSTQKSHLNSSYSVLAQDYIGPLKSTFFISGDNDIRVENMRLNFSQYDAQGRLLSFLKATQFEFGDITATKTALAHTAGLSRGFRVFEREIHNQR